jgi:hypothetical protein
MISFIIILPNEKVYLVVWISDKIMCRCKNDISRKTALASSAENDEPIRFRHRKVAAKTVLSLIEKNQETDAKQGCNSRMIIQTKAEMAISGLLW